MGQAKRRGTYEERKASAIHDLGVVSTILAKQEKEWWDALTPDEQKRVVTNRISKKIVRKIKKQFR